jgi:hypothetical protein
MIVLLQVLGVSLFAATLWAALAFEGTPADDIDTDVREPPADGLPETANPAAFGIEGNLLA